MLINDAIKKLRDQYVNNQKVDSYFEINNGLCEDFCLDVITMMGGATDHLYDVETGNFMDDGSFDVGLLETHWQVTLPEGLTWGDINASIMVGAHHVWAVYNNRHYDAECPEGVDSLFDLPIFKRYIVFCLREKGIAVDEVVTEDVKPCPLCPIPNPVDEGMGMVLKVLYYRKRLKQINLLQTIQLFIKHIKLGTCSPIISIANNIDPAFRAR